MATSQRNLRPLRIGKLARNTGSADNALPAMPERVQRSLAPNWVSPTEDNGVALPRTELHIALVIEDDGARAFVVQPPLWPGKVILHVLRDIDPQAALIKQALMDLGWADARDILEPVNVMQGYPSGSEQ